MGAHLLARMAPAARTENLRSAAIATDPFVRQPSERARPKTHHGSAIGRCLSRQQAHRGHCFASGYRHSSRSDRYHRLCTSAEPQTPNCATEFQIGPPMLSAGRGPVRHSDSAARYCQSPHHTTDTLLCRVRDSGTDPLSGLSALGVRPQIARFVYGTRRAFGWQVRGNSLFWRAW